MRTLTYQLRDLKKVTIEIGFEGENNRTQVRIDCGEVFAEYPNAEAALKVQAPKGGIYPATVTRDGNMILWTVRDCDVANKGNGEFQLTFTDGETVVKTCPGKIHIDRSLKGSGTAPSGVQDWLDNAEKVLEDLEDAEVNQPKIVEGNWYVYNVETGEYVDTGVKAQGEDGDPGQPGTDATPDLITVPYEDLTFPVAAGTQCYHDGKLYEANQAIQTSEQWTAAHWTETTVEGQIGQLKSAIDGVSTVVDDLNDHETYIGGSVTEYEPVTANTTVNEARMTINGYGYAAVSVPSFTNMIIYPVENGKTYKVKGYCNNTDGWPLLIVADTVKSSSGAIANPNTFEYVLGTNITEQVEEKEYTALRNGYLYLVYSDSSCGLWLKKEAGTKKYHIDDVLKNIEGIDSVLNKIVRIKADSSSRRSKVVPRNAEPIAKVTNLANTITTVRSILSRNVANKNAVGDVEVKADHTMKKGIRTAWLPAGRYRIDLGSMGIYSMVKYFEKGLYSATLYQDQFPMTLALNDPDGGYFIVYADTVSALGNMDGLCIKKLLDGETTITYEAYSEKTYTPEEITSNNRIEVAQNGIIEFVNSGDIPVASTVEYVLFGKGDDTTTRKDFITSPDGTKFLPMIKNDGSVVGARVIPKKALFIGNSLTSGWQTFGEAATDSDKDFVGRFGAVVADLDSDYTFNRKWSTQFEQQTSLANAQTWVTTNIDPLLDSDIDLIVVQLSDNVIGNASANATFPSSSLWLLQHLREECPKARVVWLGVWFDRGWVKTLLDNTAQTGCEYVDMRPIYLPENVSYIGEVYKMDSAFQKEYTVDSFTVEDGHITLVFTVDGKQYTSTIPSYTSYESSGSTLTVTGIYHVVSTYYESIHPNDEGFRRIANKLLFDLGISDSEETIPADE